MDAPPRRLPRRPRRREKVLRRRVRVVRVHPVVPDPQRADAREHDVLARLRGDAVEIPEHEKRARAHPLLRLHAPDAELTVVHRGLLVREAAAVRIRGGRGHDETIERRDRATRDLIAIGRQLRA
jgi:hypothetical protein